LALRSDGTPQARGGRDETQYGTGCPNDESAPGWALPEDHPLVPQLNRIFGDHTYFLDGSGLNILEPAAAALEVPPSSIGEVGVLVNVANWTDSNPPKLEVHEPELTNTTLGTDGDGS
jgi:hypothetical protein